MTTLKARSLFDSRRRWFDRALDRLLRRPPLRIEVGPMSPLHQRVAEGLMTQGIALLPYHEGPFVVYVDNLPKDDPHMNGFYMVQMSWHMPGTTEISRHSGID